MTGLRFMVADGCDDELLAAVAANHIDWLQRLARGSKGTVAVEEGVHWTHVSRTRSEVTAAVLQSPDPGVRAHTDRLLDFCRAQGVHRFGYWAFSADHQWPLGVWLGARGFRAGGRPHWMYLDLQTVTDLPSAEALATETGFALTDRFLPREGTELPCFDPDTAWVREAMAAQRPQRVWHGVQWDGGEPVGQVSIDVTTGDRGVCGLHDTVITPGSRISGIGISRLLWVCRFASDLGCRYLVTNAAEGNAALFGVWGFRSLGFGRTWWLSGDALRHSVAPAAVAFAEAIGNDDLDALGPLHRELGSPDLDASLANGMTPLQFAGAAGSRQTAGWLLERRARPDVLAAWDLGGAPAVRELLEAHPELLDQRRPRSGKTLLHIAAERGDAELAVILLEAGIDTEITDHRSGRTALQWARHLRRVGVAAAITRHEAGDVTGPGIR